MNKVKNFLRNINLRSFTIIVSAILTLNFFFNPLGIIYHKDFKYANWDKGDERMAMHRLQKSWNDGVFSDGMFPGSYGPDTVFFEGVFVSPDYMKENKFDLYISQPGGQLFIWSVLTKYLPLGIYAKYHIATFFACVLASLLMALLLAFIYFNVSREGALFLLGTFIISPVMLSFVHSLWWSYFAFLLPVLLLYQRGSSEKQVFVSILLLTLFKYFLNGFEFITSYFGSVFLVLLIVYARNNVQVNFRRLVNWGTAMFVATLTCLSLLFVQISLVRGPKAAIERIEYSFLKRSGSLGGISKQLEDKYNLKESIYAQSLNSSLSQVLYDYNTKDVFKLPARIRYGLYKYKRIPFQYWHLALLGIIAGLAIYLINRKIRYLALVLLSYLLSISWYLVFKGHAFIHKPLDEVVMYMPFIPVVMVVIGLAVKELVQYFRRPSLETDKLSNTLETP